jgi:hypothetical protein
MHASDPVLTCAACPPFCAVPVARQVTLYTRGKKAITEQIADDTDRSYQNFARSIKHIKGDRQVRQPTRAGVQGRPALRVLRVEGSTAWNLCMSRHSASRMSW